MKEEAKQKLAQQREAMSLKHQEEVKELKEEHEGEIKVSISTVVINVAINPDSTRGMRAVVLI